MHCTHCGADQPQSRACCRQCGKWIGRAAPEERMTVMIIFNALSALFGAASAFALFSEATRGAQWAINLAGIFCVMVSVYQTISFGLALSLRMRQKREEGQRKLEKPGAVAALRAADTSQFVPVPRVTENTTKLLERDN